MNAFEVMIYNLNHLGFYGFLLPWVFIFAVLFALLLKTKALGEDKRVIGVVSLAVAFFVMAFGGPAMASFFTTFFGILALVIAGFIGIILLVSLTGADIGKTFNTKSTIMILTGIAVVIFVIAIGSYGISVNDNIVGIVFILALLGIAVMFVTKS